MNRYVISQIVEAIGGIFFIIEACTKNKKIVFLWSFLEELTTTIGNFIQGTVTAGICTFFSLFRSGFGYLKLNTKLFNIIYSFLLITFSIPFNHMVIDWFPVVASLQLTWGMRKGLKIGKLTENATSKIMWMINTFLWIFYEIYYKQIAWIFISIISVMFGIISLYKMTKMGEFYKVDSVKEKEKK